MTFAADPTVVPLTLEEQGELLRAARQTLDLFLREGRRGFVPPTSSPALQRPAGAFVSLHQEGHLRGCVGTFTGDRTLLETVCEMAIAAGTRDPRFSPLPAAQCGTVEIEISVLSPARVARADELVIGLHGVMISAGSRRGVLLPQVATSYGWDRETFLTQTCIKAGLDALAWQRPETQIELFVSQVFAESSRNRDPLGTCKEAIIKS